ncbi:uncharacterized protein LOC114535422 [Dendronephthya gigantea]|uniref:uncharacterized protein LOC114535422 n=1 Tax=Dendronephthya gigantea TaxID=151771 RepID=UPI00106BA32A|nr:uncharacterized protein LOC114535422 [Dendronephthya gigantea]
MLLDTGSAVTLVHKRLLDRVNQGEGMSKAQERVVSANGQPLGILGTCKLRIRLGGVDVYHTVLVASDITQDCLIGVDFLAKYDCKINFGMSSVNVGGREVSMGNRFEEGGTCERVRLAETVTVPGGHEMIMSADVRAISDEVTGIVEPCPEFFSKHSILVARIVTKPRDNHVPVRLLNPSQDPVTIYRDTTLGTFSPANVESPVEPNSEVYQVKSVRGKAKSSKSPKTTLTQLLNLENTDIDSSQKLQLEEFLSDFEDVVSKGSSDLGRTNRVRHRIPTGDAAPIKQSPR